MTSLPWATRSPQAAIPGLWSCRTAVAPAPPPLAPASGADVAQPSFLVPMQQVGRGTRIQRSATTNRTGLGRIGTGAEDYVYQWIVRATLGNF